MQEDHLRLTHVAHPSRNTFESIHVSNWLSLATNSQNCRFLVHFFLFCFSCWAFIKLHFGGKSFGESSLDRRIRRKEVQVVEEDLHWNFRVNLTPFFPLSFFSTAVLRDWFVLIILVWFERSLPQPSLPLLPLLRGTQRPFQCNWPLNFENKSLHV